MKFWLTAISILILSTLSAQSYQELITAADQQYQAKEYEQSAKSYAQAFDIEMKNPSHLYNGACSAALAGQKAMALKFLESSIENGWTNVRHMKKDRDLNSLHETEKWSELIGIAQAALDQKEANYNKPLQKELLAIHEDDQGIRHEYITIMNENREDPRLDSLGKIMRFKDSVNLIKIKHILDEHGWVGPETVGRQASQTIFLVIQHADLVTQQLYLPMMREAVSDKRASGSALALLEDRVALREGRLQTYGSQVGTHPDTKENYVLPLEDPDNVDKRRHSVGLGKLADYVSLWNIEWDVEAYKKKLPAYLELQKK